MFAAVNSGFRINTASYNRSSYTVFPDAPDSPLISLIIDNTASNFTLNISAPSCLDSSIVISPFQSLKQDGKREREKNATVAEISFALDYIQFKAYATSSKFVAKVFAPVVETNLRLAISDAEHVLNNLPQCTGSHEPRFDALLRQTLDNQRNITVLLTNATSPSKLSLAWRWGEDVGAAAYGNVTRAALKSVLFGGIAIGQNLLEAYKVDGHPDVNTTKVAVYFASMFWSIVRRGVNILPGLEQMTEDHCLSGRIAVPSIRGLDQVKDEALGVNDFQRSGGEHRHGIDHLPR